MLSLLIIRGFIPEDRLQPTTPPTIESPQRTPFPTASPLVFRQELPEYALTASQLGVTQTCKPFTGNLSQISYARDNDESFLGIITDFRVGNMKVQVNDYLYDRIVIKDVVHNQPQPNTNSITTRYYDKACNEILPGKIQVGDRAIIFAPSRSGVLYYAQYVQIITI